MERIGRNTTFASVVMERDIGGSMIDIRLLAEELRAEKLPVEGVSLDGTVLYSRDLTAEERTLAAKIISDHYTNDPELLIREYREARKNALALLTSGIDGWATMTAAQKQAWIGTNFDEIMRILRALIKITT